MTLPAIVKTWTFSVNQRIAPVASTGTFPNAGTLRRVMWSVKEALKGWGWAVKGSIGGGSGAMDNVDRWIAATDLVWGRPGTDPVASWIVLERIDAAGVGLDLELLIWLRSAVAGGRATEVAAYLSYAGFTGGTAATRPTAVDELQVIGTGDAAAPWTALEAASDRNPTCWLHATRTTDNEVQRVVVTADGAPLLYFAAERAADPVAGWTHPFACLWLREPTYAALHAAAGARAYDAGAPAAWMALHLTAPVAGGAAIGVAMPLSNSIDGAPFLSSIGLVCSVGKSGRHGGLYDAWFAPQGALTGDNYPADAPRFAVVGDLVVPWDGESPLRS